MRNPSESARHGPSVEDMSAADRELGVSQSVEVHILLTREDPPTREEAVYFMVVGAGFDPVGGGLGGGTKSCPRKMNGLAFARPKTSGAEFTSAGRGGHGG